MREDLHIQREDQGGSRPFCNSTKTQEPRAPWAVNPVTAAIRIFPWDLGNAGKMFLNHLDINSLFWKCPQSSEQDPRISFCSTAPPYPKLDFSLLPGQHAFK